MQQPMQQQPMQQRSPMVQRPQASQPIPTRMQQPIRQPPPSQPIRSGPFVPPPMQPGGGADSHEMGMPPGTYDGIGGGTGSGPGGRRPPIQPGGTFDANDVMANPEKYGMDSRAIASVGADVFSKYLKDAQDQETKFPGSTHFSQKGPGPNMPMPPSGGTDPYANAQPMPKPGDLGSLPGAYENNVASVQRNLNMQPGGGIGMMTPNNPNSGMQMEKPMQVGGGGVGMMMPNNPNETGMTMGAFKRGGQVKAVKKYAKGGAVKASSRGDGIAQRGKTKGKIY